MKIKNQLATRNKRAPMPSTVTLPDVDTVREWLKDHYIPQKLDFNLAVRGLQGGYSFDDGLEVPANIQLRLTPTPENVQQLLITEFCMALKAGTIKPR